MPATIDVNGGLVNPTLWRGQRFPAVRQRVNPGLFGPCQVNPELPDPSLAKHGLPDLWPSYPGLICSY